MRKLTALTVALSLSVAGQAFAGPRHAPAVHAAAAHLHATSEAGATHAPNRPSSPRGRDQGGDGEGNVQR